MLEREREGRESEREGAMRSHQILQHCKKEREREKEGRVSDRERERERAILLP